MINLRRFGQPRQQSRQSIKISPIPWALLLIFLFAPATTASIETKPFFLAATIFPAADIIRNVAGPGVGVIQILPAGASPHTFDLTPGKIRELQKVDIIFKISGMDDWIDGIAESVPRAAIISLRKNIALQPFQDEFHQYGAKKTRYERDFDPHYWLNAENGAMMAQTVCDVLCAHDPARAQTFRENCRLYRQTLLNLHDEIKKELAGLKSNKMIVFHDAWRYFAAAYGLEISGVFQASPGQEPTPRDIQKLYAQVKELKIKVIFSELQLPSASLEAMLEDLGLELIVLDPLGGSSPADSYVNLLRRNARAIRRALGR
jgi:ABC-type Zn uptake system ZnuABC Zn-binding protein ZnuA